mgnify:CR=1 FL=1
MDERSQQKLTEILAKEIQALTDNDIAFLKARSSYLSASEAEKYKKVLKEKVEVTIPEKIEAEKEVEEVAYKELQAQASALGMEKVVGVSKDKLIEFITEEKKKKEEAGGNFPQ